MGIGDVIRGGPFGSGRELGRILEEVARLGVAPLVQVALEPEVTEFLGRHVTLAASATMTGCAMATPGLGQDLPDYEPELRATG